MGSLINQATEAYNSWKTENRPTDVSGWTDLTDTEALALWRTEQQYLAAIEDARLIEESFYAARTQAFADLEATQLAARTALQNSWQAKEDNGFDVDYGV